MLSLFRGKEMQVRINCMPSSAIERRVARTERAWPRRFTVFILLLTGCREPTCPGDRSGDLDDRAPQAVCTGDKVRFSPTRIQTSSFPDLGSSSTGDAGTVDPPRNKVSVSLTVTNDSGAPRALANVNVFESMDGTAEEAVEGASFGTLPVSLAVGTCVEVSATRLHCLTDYDGQASFKLDFQKPAEGCIRTNADQARSEAILLIRNGNSSPCESDAGNTAGGGAS